MSHSSLPCDNQTIVTVNICLHVCAKYSCTHTPISPSFRTSPVCPSAATYLLRRLTQPMTICHFLNSYIKINQQCALPLRQPFMNINSRPMAFVSSKTDFAQFSQLFALHPFQSFHFSFTCLYLEPLSIHSSRIQIIKMYIIIYIK